MILRKNLPVGKIGVGSLREQLISGLKLDFISENSNNLEKNLVNKIVKELKDGRLQIPNNS